MKRSSATNGVCAEVAHRPTVDQDEKAFRRLHERKPAGRRHSYSSAHVTSNEPCIVTTGSDEPPVVA
jgi:hypothetical protein